MATINISTNEEVDTINLNEQELGKLEKVFLNSKKDKLLINICKSAFEQQKKILLNKVQINNIHDFRAYHLYLYSKYIFDNRIPKETTVARLFHIKINQARNIIRDCIATYREELSDTLVNTFKHILEQKKFEYNGETEKLWSVNIYNKPLVEELNGGIANAEGGHYDKIYKKRGSIAKYLFPEKSFTFLDEQLSKISK